MKICIIKVGNIVDGLINVLTLGWGKDIAGWIALKQGTQTADVRNVKYG